MPSRTRRLRFAAATLLLALLTSRPTAQSAASGDVVSEIDRIAEDVLKSTGVPSASVSVVRDGAVLMAKAYGEARFEPRVPATPAMRYSVGSISKQFTSAAVLLLQEDERLSLNDPVGKYVPGLTRGDEVTIRQVLSHTSGYQDFWPQDYVPPDMLKPITASGILDRWARRSLDFDPGTRWQYSNTNFVIAGLIVEKAAGMPLWAFLQQRIFQPLQMRSVVDSDAKPLGQSDPTGYFRYALGPARPAPIEGAGWMFAAGELAMTAEDLARWNLSLIKQTVLTPASYREMEREVVLANGVGTGYGLGVQVGSTSGHRQISHTGEVSGFVSANVVLPDDGMAVAVLTNQDAAPAASQIARRIVRSLISRTSAGDERQIVLARRAFDGLREGRIDRSLFTDNANAYFTEQGVRDYADSLKPLGAVETFRQSTQALRGGMTFRSIDVKLAKKSVRLSIYEMPDGRFEQFLVEPGE